MLKKIMKTALVILGIILVAGLVFAFIYRETIGIMLGNNTIKAPEITGQAIESAEIEPITKGEADWLCWRGINGDGKSGVTGIRIDWSNGLKKIWEIDFLCLGDESATWFAPVIQGNRLVVCGRDNENDIVFCLDPEDGRLIWRQAYPAKPSSSSYGTGFRATPWIDYDRVYTFGRAGDLICWNLLDGDKIWHKNVSDEGGKEPTWGHASSPFVTDSLVVVKGGGEARTIAFDKMTGDMKWKAGQGVAGYAAVSMMEIEGEPVILSFHGKGLAAVTLDGRELWDTGWETSYDVNATTPVTKDDLVFITSGYDTGGELLRVTQTRAEVAWKNRNIASHHSDPFIIDGYIYGYSGDSMQNKGAFKCVELETGIERWSTNEIGWGTCLLVDGYLLCCDVKGNLFLIKPDPEKFVKITELPKVWGRVRGATWTIPVVANGKLYLRFNQGLMCFDIKAG